MGNRDSTLTGKIVHKFVETARFCMTRQNQERIFKGNMINMMLRELAPQPALAL